MLKHAFKASLRYELPRNVYFSTVLTLTKCKNVKIFARTNYLVTKLNHFYFTHLVVKNSKHYTKNNQPAVLLSFLSLFGFQSRKSDESEPKTFDVIKRSLSIMLGLQEPESEESELIMTIKRGILLIRRKKYDQAEQMLHLALKMAQDLQDEDGVTYVFDTLANLAFEVHQFEKAEKLFVSVIQRLLVKGEPKDSNKIVDISLKLAKIYEAKKDPNKAEQGYKFCIETLDKKLDTEDIDTLALWGMSMDWYARFLLGANRKSEALTCLKKAYEMCVKVNGVDHEQTVVLLNDLGTIYSLLGDNESAVHYLEKAKDLAKKLPEVEDLPSIYINLGLLYFMKKMYRESTLACQEGLKLAKSQGDDVAITEGKLCLEKIKDFMKGNKISNVSKPLASLDGNK